MKIKILFLIIVAILLSNCSGRSVVPEVNDSMVMVLLQRGNLLYAEDNLNLYEKEASKYKPTIPSYPQTICQAIHLRYYEICTDQAEMLRRNMPLIKDLRSIWEDGVKKWEYRELRSDAFLISGYGLGLFSDKPCIGQWYVYSSSIPSLEPADVYAQSLNDF